MQNIIFHSDDYGMSIDSSKYILDCCDQGVLNSVAIIANSPYTQDCCQLLAPYVAQSRIDISVHLNLVEGKALCPPDSLPLLTDRHGFFCHSFEKLLFLSFTSKRNELKREIKQELLAQIQKIQTIFPEAHLALDSHQHFHMIPLVFNALLEIIQENSLPVRYVRVSKEPLMPFIQTPRLYTQIRPVNVVKNILLNIFSWHDLPRLKALGIPTNLFWGLIFSGDMHLEMVQTLLPKFIEISRKRSLPLEILSHPCPIPDISECMDPEKKSFVSFYTSSGRLREATMLKSIQL